MTRAPAAFPPAGRSAATPTPTSGSPRSASPPAYIGKVEHDPLGQAFIADIRSTGIAFDTRPAEHGPATGRCFVYVTPDGERTMNTYLGASTYLAPPPDNDEAALAAAIAEAGLKSQRSRSCAKAHGETPAASDRRRHPKGRSAAEERRNGA